MQNEHFRVVSMFEADIRVGSNAFLLLFDSFRVTYYFSITYIVAYISYIIVIYKVAKKIYIKIWEHFSVVHVWELKKALRDTLTRAAFVWTLFDNGKLANQIARLAAILAKKIGKFPEKLKTSRKSEVRAKASKLENFEKSNWTETFQRKFLAIGSPKNEIRVLGPMKSPQCIFYAVLICLLVHENVT